MDEIKHLFRQWTDDLAPGVQNPGQIVRDRILYNSCEKKPRREARNFHENMMPLEPAQKEKAPEEKIAEKPQASKPADDRFAVPAFDPRAMDVDPTGKFTELPSPAAGDGDDGHGPGKEKSLMAIEGKPFEKGDKQRDEKNLADREHVDEDKMEIDETDEKGSEEDKDAGLLGDLTEMVMEL